MIHKLKAKDLTWRCPVSWLPKKDSTSIKPASTMVAQDRAVDAIGFGESIQIVIDKTLRGLPGIASG